MHPTRAPPIFGKCSTILDPPLVRAHATFFYFFFFYGGYLLLRMKGGVVGGGTPWLHSCKGHKNGVNSQGHDEVNLVTTLFDNTAQ